MSKITIKDIAKALNLSISTISRALNDSHEISQATKEKVMTYAKSKNYHPNTTARNLKLGKTNKIGLVLPFIDSPFFTQYLEEILETIVPYHYNLILKQSRNDEKMERTAIEELLQQDIDGLIISPSRETSNLELLKTIQKKMPVIIFDRISHHLDTYKIGIDNSKETYTATKELLRQGRTQIAILCNNDIGANSSRLAGYYKALKEHDISTLPQYVIYTSYHHPNDDIDEIIKGKLVQLKQAGQLPNAIISTTDTLSVRILSNLRDLGINVPNDIAVIGFANTHMAYSLNPPLSTITQPARQMAKVTIETLVQALKNLYIKSGRYEKKLLESIITLRESTKVKS